MAAVEVILLAFLTLEMCMTSILTLALRGKKNFGFVLVGYLYRLAGPSGRVV